MVPPLQSEPFLLTPPPGGRERGSASGGESSCGLKKKLLADTPLMPLCTGRSRGEGDPGTWGGGTPSSTCRVGDSRPEGTGFQHEGRPSPGPKGHRHDTAPVWGAGLARKQLLGLSRPSVTPTICPSPRSPRRHTAAAPDPASGRTLLVDGKPPVSLPGGPIQADPTHSIQKWQIWVLLLEERKANI